MITNEYRITAAQGLHARPATALVKLAKNYKSTISLKKDEKTARLNSPVIAEGEDEAEAAEAIDAFFKEQLKEM
jgi:phosphocarrier protein HPr